MVTIEKQKPEDVGVTKLIITAPKDALAIPKLAPKEFKPTQQVIKPDEPENTDSLFIIY